MSQGNFVLGPSWTRVNFRSTPDFCGRDKFAVRFARIVATVPIVAFYRDQGIRRLDGSCGGRDKLLRLDDCRIRINIRRTTFGPHLTVKSTSEVDRPAQIDQVAVNGAIYLCPCPALYDNVTHDGSIQPKEPSGPDSDALYGHAIQRVGLLDDEWRLDLSALRPHGRRCCLLG